MASATSRSRRRSVDFVDDQANSKVSPPQGLWPSDTPAIAAIDLAHDVSDPAAAPHDAHGVDLADLDQFLARRSLRVRDLWRSPRVSIFQIVVLGPLKVIADTIEQAIPVG